jgi:negative regulator of flagellin synthesis FlgM
MRISGTILPGTVSVERTQETAPVEAPSAADAAPAKAGAELQSAVLKPALTALREMPDIDHAKVAELRDALARGDIRFDASRLAGLIQRFHGGKS